MQKIKQKLTNFIEWAKNNKKKSIPLALLVLTLVVGGIVLALTRSGTGVDRIDPNVDANGEVSNTVASPLTGLQVTPEKAERPVTMAVIENSPEARPQSGMHKAGIVFESIAEGGITRFVTLYQESRPDPLGPIRSLRPYFIDWVLTYDASAAHVGGSAQAQQEARDLNIKDLDQFANGGSYYRTTDRFAPHNVYTDFGLLDKLNKEKGFTDSEFEPLPRKDANPLNVVRARNITIDISSYTYQSDYTYNKSTNSYDRFIAGQPDKDRESGKRISPKVLVVINTPYSIASDGRYSYDLIGSGKATVFQDGNVIKGKWSRNSREGQFKFTNTNGNEIKFNPGQTWFTAISPDQNVSFSK